MPLPRGKGGLLVGCLKQTCLLPLCYFQTVGERNRAESELAEASPGTELQRVESMSKQVGKICQMRVSPARCDAPLFYRLLESA